MGDQPGVYEKHKTHVATQGMATPEAAIHLTITTSVASYENNPRQNIH